MNVDKQTVNARTLPKQRVIYLNSSASNKNLAQQQRIAQSKSQVALEPLGGKHAASYK